MTKSMSEMKETPIRTNSYVKYQGTTCKIVGSLAFEPGMWLLSKPIDRQVSFNRRKEIYSKNLRKNLTIKVTEAKLRQIIAETKVEDIVHDPGLRTPNWRPKSAKYV